MTIIRNYISSKREKNIIIITIVCVIRTVEPVTIVVISSLASQWSAQNLMVSSLLLYSSRVLIAGFISLM